MYAFEFKAKPENGRIEIPPQYREKLNRHVKVIVLIDSEVEENDFIEELMRSPLQLPQFKPLNREEIYERQ